MEGGQWEVNLGTVTVAPPPAAAANGRGVRWEGATGDWPTRSHFTEETQNRLTTALILNRCFTQLLQRRWTFESFGHLNQSVKFPSGSRWLVQLWRFQAGWNGELKRRQMAKAEG